MCGGKAPPEKMDRGANPPNLGNLGYVLLFGDFPYPKPVSQRVPLDC